MKNDLNKADFYKTWCQYESCSVFGLSHVCKNTLSELKRLVKVDCILDNNRNLDGQIFETVPVKAFQAESIGGRKILVATHYKSIKNQLEQIGLRENVDFCSLEKFLTVMLWVREKKVYLNEVHISVTTKCTLKCANCNMFMPEYQTPEHLQLDAVLLDIDTFFSKVDMVSTFGILGGEPLLYPYLKEVLLHLQKYLDKIGTIEVISNGTILPSEQLLSTFKECHVFFRISDYTQTIPYQKQLLRLEELLKEWEIPYYINHELEWLDFGFPHRPICVPDAQVFQHMLDCGPAFKGLNDKKLYFCHIVWSAEKAGVYRTQEHDYVKLETADRDEIVEYALGNMKQAVSLCKYCAGCDSDYSHVIQVAKQAGGL